MTAWRKAVTEHVWRHGAFPPEARGQRADAGVTFVVDRSGQLISSALVAKSPGPNDTKLNSMLRSICRGC